MVARLFATRGSAYFAETFAPTVAARPNSSLLDASGPE